MKHRRWRDLFERLPRADVPYGVLDFFVLKTLDAMGPLHGFGPARSR
ncbi:MAG: hypothetical protein OXF93_14675 [Acidobacteria bacterium]|nr:hypothetical protein [Acidobacteriota bacterium]